MSRNQVEFPIYAGTELYYGPLSETEIKLILGGVAIMVFSNMYLWWLAILGPICLWIPYNHFRQKGRKSFFRHTLYARGILMIDSHVFVKTKTTWKG